MTNSPALDVRLRPITQADREPLYAIHRAAMRAYVEETWGWDENVQRRFWTRTAHDEVQIIEYNGDLVGYLDVREHEDQVDIVNIVLDPRVHGRGIGSVTIQEIVDRAVTRGMDVRLQVLKVNPRAKALYDRLGFEPDGESETHIRMLRRSSR